MLHLNKFIENLHQELIDNKGIVPDSWKPALAALKLFLTGIEAFVPVAIKALIVIIIEAINITEGN
jgi:hypothetical protein